MSNFKPNYFQRRSKPQGPKANERIRAIDVQVIGSDGNNLGILPLNKAIEAAKSEGLDLIEIDYLEIVDRSNMEKLEIIDRPALVAIAVFIGKTRLIDNIEINFD